MKQVSGALSIAAERRYQTNNKGFTNEHDDKWVRGELVQAANCYQRAAVHVGRGGLVEEISEPFMEWPWDERWWKPVGHVESNLVKAGALIAAEIDRLRRKRLADS